MEKTRLFIFSFLILIAGILVFTLTKSWLVYDRGIQIIPAVDETDPNEDSKEESREANDPPFDEDWKDQARIYGENALLYPVGLNTESGGLGPDGIMHHARNLITVNLQTGKKRKLFPKNVYVWDFFQADFRKKTGFTSGDEPKVDSLALDSKVLIFAATKDTNLDGFLNHKDKKKVFLYDTAKDRFTEVLSSDYYFEKILWNAGKNRLALVVRKAVVEEGTDRVKLKFESPVLFIYDAGSSRNTIVPIHE